MTNLSQKEISKYDHVYLNHPEYGQVNADYPRFVVTLNYLMSIHGVKTILDAGVGKGGFYSLVKNGYDVYGIEPSKVAIEKFHKDDNRIKKICIQDIPSHFSEELFDVVVCLDVLEHIPPDDIDLTLSSLAFCGKKYLIFSIANHQSVWDGLPLHVSIFSFEEWEEKLKKYFNVLYQTPICGYNAVVYLLEKHDYKDNNLVFDRDKLQKLETERLVSGKEYTPRLSTPKKFLIKDSLHNVKRAEMSNIKGSIPGSGQVSIAGKFLAQASEINEQVFVNSQPLFSVIVPTYNQAEFLPVALDSILSQTYDNWEAIVVNDGSTDQTVEVMNGYAKKDARIRIIHKTNGGVASALNEGIKTARGEWICWLSSDDMFEPEKLEVHLQAIKENPDIRFFHTNYFLFDEERSVKCALKSDPGEFIPPVELQVLHYFERNYTNGISVAIHREVFDQVGCFNEKYRYGQDFDMWLRINARYRALFIDQKTCVTRWHRKQGMRSFPGAGCYDSSQACIEFLNSHEFGECFPVIDLTTAQGAAKAIKETLAVIFNLNAMMYKCYFNTALLERLGEWLSQHCPDDLKQALMPHLTGTIDNLKNSLLPEEVRAALKIFSDNMVNKFCFTPHDFQKEAAQYAQKLFTAGESKKADSIERYLSLIKSQHNHQNSSHDRPGPLVSVIMPPYNASRHIAKAIESVLSQNYRNFELIIVDDGSTDNTKDVITGFKDNRIKYFYKEKEGAASARNLAVKKSEGSFIVILDADDMMMPDLISSHLHEFEKHPETDLVYCDDCLIDRDGKPIRVIESPEYTDEKSLIRDLFRSGFPIVPFRTCIRKSVFDKIGFYDESLSFGEGYDMIRRFVKHGLKIHHLRSAPYLRHMGFDCLSGDFATQKAKCLFEVLRRFAETFTYNELFPDVAWEKISPQRRQLRAKYLIAATYLAIGQVHVKVSSPPVYNEIANEFACTELNGCLKSEPDNRQIRELLQKCESGKQRYDEMIQQTVY